jgi:hypothetical protein
MIQQNFLKIFRSVIQSEFLVKFSDASTSKDSSIVSRSTGPAFNFVTPYLLQSLTFVVGLMVWEPPTLEFVGTSRW